VVSKELKGLNNSLTVNAGSNSNVNPGMPVINSAGLVGQVILTADSYSQVLPYANSLFRVSAIIEGTRAYGIVSWISGSNRDLILQYVPQTIPVEVGQLVETSGYSNQYPPGIPIGEITRIEPADGVETQTIYLQAYADLFTLSEAFIVNFVPDSTIDSLNVEQQELF
jgi:rod shape-determining protein MreC